MSKLARDHVGAAHPALYRGRRVFIVRSSMIGLSVAIGRFVEALFWAIFRVAGTVAGVAIVTVLGLIAAGVLARRLMRRRR